MRFQNIGPADVLNWLGVGRIDKFMSMSDMKYNALVSNGIEVVERQELPDHLLPTDAHVEIDAKIFAGYYSATKSFTQDELTKTVGRGWEDIDH